MQEFLKIAVETFELSSPKIGRSCSGFLEKPIGPLPSNLNPLDTLRTLKPPEIADHVNPFLKANSPL